jgi:predicted hydrocarbon binding protein
MNLTSNRLVALSHDALHALRSALFRDYGAGAASALQEAGYAGGPAVHAAFEQWLASRGEGASRDIPAARFPELATDFFREAGWGSLSITGIGAVAAADSPDWAESDPAHPLDFPGCYYTAGVFAHFFGELSGESVGVMEVECRSAGAELCRFLVGTPDALQQVYDQMGAGATYEDAAASLIVAP